MHTLKAIMKYMLAIILLVYQYVHETTKATHNHGQNYSNSYTPHALSCSCVTNHDCYVPVLNKP